MPPGIGGASGSHEVADGRGIPRLSGREAQILASLARGRTQKQVARELRIALGTVARHCHDLCGKLGAANITEAACLAVSLGLVPPQRNDPTAARAARATRPRDPPR